MVEKISSPNGIILVDEKGQVIFCDENAQGLLPDQQLLGKQIDIVIENMDNKNITFQMTNLIRNANFKNDLKCYLFYCSEPIPESDEMNLEKLQEILNNSYDEIFVVNSKGIVTYVNNASERNYGLKPSEIIGKTVYHLVEEGYYSPSIAPVVFKEKKRVTLTQETMIGKKLVVTATPILDGEGNIDLVVMNTRDITEIEKLKCNLEDTEKLVQKYKQEVEELRKKEYKYEHLVVRSKSMKECVVLAQKVSSTDSTVLILGDSGTGKNVMAKYIHHISNRKNGPFKTINCAAIPDQLLESELFGYHRGAFTGANTAGKVGLLELSDGGTLFLDEIAEIPLRLQAKLLEVIQENRFVPVGGTEYKNIDIRIIAATNRDLEKMVRDGLFREDLYYRINVIELEIPPLRDRLEDIVFLAHYFLNIYDKKYGMSHYFSQDSLDTLITHSWSGNVRELQHVVERLVITVKESKILPEHFPKSFSKSDKAKANLALPNLVPLDVLEEELIIKAYKQLGSSYKVAKALNISQSKANRRIRRYLNK